MWVCFLGSVDLRPIKLLWLPNGMHTNVKTYFPVRQSHIYMKSNMMATTECILSMVLDFCYSSTLSERVIFSSVFRRLYQNKDVWRYLRDNIPKWLTDIWWRFQCWCNRAIDKGILEINLTQNHSASCHLWLFVFVFRSRCEAAWGGQTGLWTWTIMPIRRVQQRACWTWLCWWRMPRSWRPCWSKDQSSPSMRPLLPSSASP